MEVLQPIDLEGTSMGLYFATHTALKLLCHVVVLPPPFYVMTAFMLWCYAAHVTVLCVCDFHGTIPKIRLAGRLVISIKY